MLDIVASGCSNLLGIAWLTFVLWMLLIQIENLSLLDHCKRILDLSHVLEEETVLREANAEETG